MAGVRARPTRPEQWLPVDATIRKIIDSCDEGMRLSIRAYEFGLSLPGTSILAPDVACSKIDLTCRLPQCQERM